MHDFYQVKDYFLSERQDLNNCSVDWIFVRRKELLMESLPACSYFHEHGMFPTARASCWEEDMECDCVYV